MVEQGGKYNPNTGEYDEPKINETVKRENVTDLGIERSLALFGDVIQGAKVIRMLRPFDGKWDYVLIDSKKYEIMKHQDLSKKNTFIVREVVNNGQ